MSDIVIVTYRKEVEKMAKEIQTLTKQLQIARDALNVIDCMSEDEKAVKTASEALTKIDELEGEKNK